MTTGLYYKFENLSGITNINVVTRKHKKGTDFRVHWHNYYELGIVLSGKFIHSINGYEHEMKKGDVYLMSFYDYHKYLAAEDSEIILISFMPDVPDRRMSYFLEKTGKNSICMFDAEELDYLLSRIEKIKTETKDSGQMSEIMLSSLLSEILILVLRKTDNNTETALPLLVRKATGYIHSNFRQVDISLNSLAQELSVSTGYLGKLLKKSLGKSFNEYLEDVRLKYACSLLELSDMTIREISKSAGYNSSTYFLQVFKKRFGTTPGEYKSEIASHMDK